MPLPYRSVLDAPTIRRVRVTPDRPDQLPQRAPGTRRPHGEAQVAAVRYLIEQTELTYGEIARKTGVGRASICRWTVDNKWVRPVFAPRATDRIPRARASAKLRRRTLAARLDALAQRYVTELESDPGVDLDKLASALELAKMAKLAAKPKQRRSKTPVVPANASPAIPALSPPVVPAQKREARLVQEAGTQGPQAQESVADTLARLRAEGVNFDRAPESAVLDFIDSHRPPEDDRALHPRGAKSRRAQAHRRMFDWGRD